MKKKPFITVETENLAVPEVHIDKEDAVSYTHLTLPTICSV